MPETWQNLNVREDDLSGLDPENYGTGTRYFSSSNQGRKTFRARLGLQAGKVMTFIGIRGVQPSVPTWMSELNPPARARAALGTSSGRC